MSREQEKELERFLRQVDKVSELVQGLQSDNASVREKAMLETDRIITANNDQNAEEERCRTKLNRTLINTNPGLQGVAAPHCLQENPETNQEYFMTLLEKDAQERAMRRKENEKLADALKEIGNEAFAKGDYETAIQRYSEGLEKLKDMQVLYTNRAQAYIKLEKYKEALSDCEWALKCNEKCIKAYVHMGRAYLGLKNYNEARCCYKKMLEIDPKCESVFKDYMNQVDVTERTALQEEKAQEEFNQGKATATTVKGLLEKLAVPSHLPVYYAGGIRLLTAMIKDCTEQTLFRTNNGFSIINDNEVIQRCLQVSVRDPVELDLCAAVLLLWQALCEGNEENQRLTMTHPCTKQQLTELLSSNVPEIQRECIALIYQYSETEFGRCLLLNNVDITRFKTLIRTNFISAVLPPFVNLLNNTKLANQVVISQCVAAIGDLVGDEYIRRELSNCKECWKACLAAVDECLQPSSGAYRDTLYALLGLMVNLTVESNSTIQEAALDTTVRCISLLRSTDGGILTRTVGLLSHILSQSSAAVEEAVKGGVMKKIIKCLKASGQTTTCYAVRTLAVCTQKSQQARVETVTSDKKFSILMKLLSSDDETVVGNTALCLGHCMDVPGAATSLLRTDILKLLLKHAGGDTKKTAVQQNAAIALGRLCTAEPRYMPQLRELHGIEILNSCMKYIK